MKKLILFLLFIPFVGYSQQMKNLTLTNKLKVDNQLQIKDSIVVFSYSDTLVNTEYVGNAINGVSLNGLSDVDTTDLDSGETLIWDGLKWINDSIDGVVTFGTDGQVPFMNVAGSDFIYKDSLEFTGDSMLFPEVVFKVGSNLIYNKKNLYLISSFGSNNLSVGKDAGLGLITGSNGNTSFGINALKSVTTADYNTAIGYNSLTLNTGVENVAVGYNTMSKTTSGVYNTVVGTKALRENLTGDNNTSIGYESGLNSTGDGNVYIGYGAGTNNTTSNKLYIENSSSANPLIYGDFANDTVRINGNFEVTGKFQTLQFSGSLTDNTPTASEIIAILGAATGNAGLKATIKDTNGSGLLYQCESDGTDWYYVAMIKSL